MIKSKRIAILGLMVLSALSVFAQNESEPMLHIHFRGEDGQEMNMTVPVTMLRQFETQIEEVLQDIEINGQDLDFAAIWQSIRETGPNEFIEVNNEEADIKVSTTDYHLLVDVNEKREGRLFNVTIPLALGDALLSGGTFDYESAIQSLLEVQGDLVRVESADQSLYLRVYIN